MSFAEINIVTLVFVEYVPRSPIGIGVYFHANKGALFILLLVQGFN